MTVALYARVSSDDQADRETIRDQTALYEKWIDLHGHTDGGQYLDDGVTGTLPMHQRPGGARLLEDIKAKKVQLVAFKNVKRLGRKTRVVLDFIDACDQAGATITSITEPFSTADAIGRFIVTILASISELDRENILEQTRAGLRRRARDGGWLGGKSAYGYRIEGRRHQAHLVLDESDCGDGRPKPAVVQWIFEQLASGSSADAVSQLLSAQGIPSWGGGAWAPAVVARMIVNPVYRGQHRHGDDKRGSVLPESYSPVPRIVSDQLWRRAGEQLEKNRRLSGKAAKRLYLLRGLLWCGTCGHAYTGMTTNSALADATDHAQGVIYRCNWRAGGHRASQGGTCDSSSLPGSIEGEVWAVVRSILENPAAIERAITERLQSGGSGQAQQEELQRLQRALIASEEGRARILGLYRRGRISESEMDTQLEEIQGETILLRQQVDAHQKLAGESLFAQQRAQNAVLEVSRLSEAHGGVLDALTRLERHQLIAALIERVTVEGGGLRIRFRFEMPEEDGGDCDGVMQGQGQINLLQQMVTDWNLPELEKKLLA